VSNPGYAVNFTPNDTANYDYTGVSGWNSALQMVVRDVVITVNPASITNTAVSVTTPAIGATPNNVASTSGNFSTGSVSWNPAHNPFLASTQYTAQVTLTAHTNYVFASSSTAAINGNNATISGRTTTSLTLSYTFPATSTKTVTAISIKTPPALTYNHGDALNLTALAVTLTYNDSTSADVSYLSFGANGLSVKLGGTAVSNGLTLNRSSHNGQELTVVQGSIEASAGNLTVNRLVPVINFPSALAVTYPAALSTSAFSGGTTSLGSFVWAAPATIPTVSNSGYQVNFTPYDTTNYDYSTVSGWNSGTGKVERLVQITVNPGLITSSAVTVTAPATGAAPNSIATVSASDNFTTGSVTWTPGDNPYKGSTQYSATVTLIAKTNYAFSSTSTASINGSSGTISNRTAGSLTVAHTFAATAAKTVSDITVTSQPSLVYIHGDTINLTALEVRLTYNDNSTLVVPFSVFSDNNLQVLIDTAVVSGTQMLSRAAHNGKITYVRLSTNTSLSRTAGTLTVGQKALSIASAAHTKSYDKTNTAAGVTVTLDGIVSPDTTSTVYPNVVTANYTAVNAGTKTLNITGVTLTGTAAGNYTVTPANGVTVSEGIKAKSISITVGTPTRSLQALDSAVYCLS